jgi:hypothetical protein
MAVSFTESAKLHLAVLHFHYNDDRNYSGDGDYNDDGVTVLETHSS